MVTLDRPSQVPLPRSFCFLAADDDTAGSVVSDQLSTASGVSGRLASGAGRREKVQEEGLI